MKFIIELLFHPTQGIKNLKILIVWKPFPFSCVIIFSICRIPKSSYYSRGESIRYCNFLFS